MRRAVARRARRLEARVGLALARRAAPAVAALAVLAGPSSARAQNAPPAPEKIAVGDWQLSPSVEVRTRGEYRRDAPDLGGLDMFGRPSARIRDQWEVAERSRLGLGAERGAVRAQLTLQDARALGSAPSAGFTGTRGAGVFAPYEAFAEVRSSGARASWARLGRQAVVWGEGRLVGSADFSPMGRSLDAARGHLAVGRFDFEALAAILEAPSPLGVPFGDGAGPAVSGVQLFGASAGWTIGPLLRLEAFGLARVARSAGDELDGSRFAASRLSGERVTAALRVSGEGDGWAYGAEGAYQLGATPALAVGGVDVSAWAAAAHVAKTVEELLFTPTFRLAGSYASGDDGKGAYKQFDPLLADPQRFHGQMDLFAWSNLVDAAARVEVVPVRDATLGVEYRYARLAQGRGEWVGGYLRTVGSDAPPPAFAPSPRAGAPGKAEEELGHELDVVVTYRPWVPFELRAGWSGLLLGDGAKATMAAHARGARLANGAVSPPDLAQYAYLQATLRMP